MPAETPPPPIAGVLLAAGTSSRMGVNKLLLEVDGESLLRRAARRALASGLEPVLVVVGHEADLARRELAGLACDIVENPEFRQGMTSSRAAGIAALPTGTPAAVVLLADMPHVSAEMIGALVSRYRETAAPLVLSDYAGVLAPPMLFDRRLFGELMALTGNHCGQRVIRHHRHEAETLSWPAAALVDLDEPADLERARAALAEVP